MTCIVGVRTKNGVLLGGDSLASAGWSSTPRKDIKVFKLTQQIACGFTSSYRMGQILRFHVQPPTITGDEYTWAVKEFVPVVRAAFKEHGYAEVDKSVERGGTFLLGVNDRLFKVDSDFQVGEPIYPFDACGCGKELALGAFHALSRAKISTKARARQALEAAEAFSNGVGGPFSFVETKS